MLGRFPVYIVPWLLVSFEWMLRSVVAQDSAIFAGPTFASIGVGLIVPLTRYGPPHEEPRVPAEVYALIKDLPVELRSKKEMNFIQICWVAVILAVIVWATTLFLALKEPHLLVGPIALTNFTGLATYVGGMVLTELRERSSWMR